MARSKYVVIRDFMAWEPENPENQTKMRIGLDLFCDIQGPGETVEFTHSKFWYAADRKEFLNSTRLPQSNTP
jgi:hypothetical protein